MNWIRNLALVFGSLLLTLVLLEMVLRLFPVNDVSRNRSLPADGTALEVSSSPNTILHASAEWDFRNARERRVNNYGFLSDFDYEPGHQGPMVIGDSYVEAVQVAFEDTFHQRLAIDIGEPVYNIAISGSPLSQYDAYLEAACREFKPTRVIIPVIKNDFDESFYAQRTRDGFFHYRADGSLKPTPFSISRLRVLLNGSSLVKYVYFNLHGGQLLTRLKKGNSKPAVQAAVKKKAAQSSLASIRSKAAAIFLQRIGKHCLAPQDILFVLDADRSQSDSIYTQQVRRSAIYVTFARDARAAGYQVLDLQPLMLASFRANGKHFEYPFDGHWNAMAHRFVANAILESGFLH